MSVAVPVNPAFDQGMDVKDRDIDSIVLQVGHRCSGGVSSRALWLAGCGGPLGGADLAEQSDSGAGGKVGLFGRVLLAAESWHFTA